MNIKTDSVHRVWSESGISDAELRDSIEGKGNS